MSRVNDEIKKGYLRITDILGKLSGIEKVPRAILEYAQDRGSRVHIICDALIQGLPVLKIEDDIKGYIDSFLQWPDKDKRILKPERFYCDKLMITGECDGALGATKNDGITIFDFKTSTEESKSWLLQGSAYYYLAQEMGYCVKDEIQFIKLCKNGSAPTVFTYKPDVDLFMKCLDVYRYFYEKRKG